MCKYIFLCVCFCVIFICRVSYGQTLAIQDSTTQVFSSTVQELLDKEVFVQSEDLVSVAGFSDATVRETQGAVTLITEEDIKLSGARDLIDVLRLVPSLDIGRDVDNVMGIAVRGHWASDARVLVLLDGIALNENSYGTFTIGHRIPLDNISRIEITRSAGSVKYGGSAALAVINIITKRKFNNLVFSSNLGVAEGGVSRGNLQIQTGKRFSNETSFSISAFVHQGDRSHQTLDFPTGQTINFADISRVHTANLNFAFNAKDFHAQFLYENHAFEASDSPLEVMMKSYHANFYYDFKPKKNLKITPRIRLNNQIPWNYSSNIPTIYEYSNTTDTRFSTDVIATYKANSYLTMTTGLVYQYDYSRFLTKLLFFKNEENTISYTNLAAFGEIVLNTKYVNISTGLRIDDHSALTPAAAPRFSITKAFKNTHFKLIYSRSFKLPTIQNFDLAEDVKPEFVQFFEAEVGAYLVNREKSKLLFTTNIYRINITDPLYYDYNEIADFESYTNFSRTGTQGLESELRYTSPKVKIIANYSLYNPYKNEVEQLDVEGNNKTFLAFPNTKMNFYLAYKITPQFLASTTMTWQNERFTYLQTDPDDEGLELIRYKPVFFGNLFLQYQNVAKTGVDIGLGMYNFLNASNVFIYPTNTSIVPIADQSREFMIRLRYTITE